jgi:hypothetical protein
VEVKMAEQLKCASAEKHVEYCAKSRTIWELGVEERNIRAKKAASLADLAKLRSL